MFNLKSFKTAVHGFVPNAKQITMLTPHTAVIAVQQGHKILLKESKDLIF